MALMKKTNLLLFLLFTYACKSSLPEETSSALSTRNQLNEGTVAVSVLSDFPSTIDLAEFDAVNLSSLSPRTISQSSLQKMRKSTSLAAIEASANEAFVKERGSIPKRFYQTLELANLSKKFSGAGLSLAGSLICSSVEPGKPPNACPNLHKLPLRSIFARQMKVGDFIIMPLQGTFHFPLSTGEAAHFFKEISGLGNRFKASAGASSVNTLAGYLKLEGLLRVAIIKTKNGARTIYGQSREFQIGGSASFNASSALSATFFPAGASSAARSFNLKNLANKPEEFKNLLLKTKEKISKAEQLYAFLKVPGTPEAIDTSIKAVTTPVDKHLTSVYSFIEKSQTSAADLMKAGQKKAGEILNRILRRRMSEEKIEERKNRAVDRLELIKKLKKFTSHSLNLAGAIQISGSALSRSVLLKDYEFNLDSEEGALAYDLAMSGAARNIIEGSMEESYLNSEKRPEFDLSVADAMSEATSNLSSAVPYVVKNRLFSSSLRTHGLSINATILNSNFSTGFYNTEENVNAYSHKTGKMDSYRIKHHFFHKNFSNPYTEKSSEKISFLSSTNHPKKNLVYLTTKYTFPRSSSEKAEKAFSKVLNTTGIHAEKLGLANLYTGNDPDVIGYQFTYGFSENVLNTLLDHSKVGIDVMWEALERTVERFNNEFGLLHNDLGIYNGNNRYQDFGAKKEFYKPMEGYRSIDHFLETKCDSIRRHMGNGICRWYADKFTYGLMELQSTNSPSEKLAEFVVEMSKIKRLLNTTQKDFVFRLLTEMHYLATSPERHSQDIYLSFRLYKKDFTDQEYSPEIDLPAI